MGPAPQGTHPHAAGLRGPFSGSGTGVAARGNRVAEKAPRMEDRSQREPEGTGSMWGSSHSEQSEAVLGR